MGNFIIIALNYLSLVVIGCNKQTTDTSDTNIATNQEQNKGNLSTTKPHAPESLSITHLLSPAPPRGAEESSLLDESSELLEEEDDSSDPPAAQNFDMVFNLTL
jgi:hypothetical protein